MTFIQIAVGVVLALIVLYAAVRIGAVAYFKSKHQFDNQQRKAQ